MAARKMHYYVLVITNDGPKFVTKVNYGDETAEWNYKEKPLEMTKSDAEDLVVGLNGNFFLAYVVSMRCEITGHPYRYDLGHLEFKRNEK